MVCREKESESESERDVYEPHLPAHRSIKKSNLLTCLCRRCMRFLSRRIMDCESRIASSVTFALCVCVCSACSLTSTALDRSDAFVEQIICNSRGKNTAAVRASGVGLLLSDTGEPVSLGRGSGPVSSASRLAYRRAGEFISEPMPVWNTDWSMTCCIITRFSGSLMQCRRRCCCCCWLPILMQMSEHPHPGLDCR